MYVSVKFEINNTIALQLNECKKVWLVAHSDNFVREYRLNIRIIRVLRLK